MRWGVHVYIWLLQGALTAAQLKNVEQIANEVSKKNQVVYMKDTPLAQAKAIKGLRAVFDEVTSLDSLNIIGLQSFVKTKVNSTQLISRMLGCMGLRVSKCQ